MVPVDCHILDKLEGIGVFLIILIQVGSHLQRTVHGNIKCQLFHQCSTQFGLIRAIYRQITFKNTRSIIHRTTHQTGKRQDGLVIRTDTVERLKFGTACRFLGNPVRISPVHTRRTNRLVRVYHNLILSRRFSYPVVVIDHPLSVVMLAARNNRSYITRFHGIIAVFLHETEGIVQLTLIVSHRRSRFMMHDDLHPFRCGIALQFLDIKIRISLGKAVNKLFGISIIVFPAFVPAFHQHCIKTVFGRKVDVFLHVRRIGSMMSVRLQLSIICLSDYNILRIGISPCRASSREILPPYADILDRLDPRSILQFTRLIQVDNQVRSQNVTSIVAHYNRTPRTGTSCLDISFCTVLVRSQVCTHQVIFRIQVQVHGRIVDQRSLVNVDVQSVVRLQHQRSLHCQVRTRRLACQGLIPCLVDELGNLRQLGGRNLEFIGIVIGRNPEGLVIARQLELRHFLIDGEVAQLFLHRELIAESQSVVEQTETDVQQPTGSFLFQSHKKFLMIVTDLTVLAPYRLPGSVRSPLPGFHNTEITVKFIRRTDLETHPAFLDYLFSLIRKRIHRHITVREVKIHDQVTIRRSQYLRQSRHRHSQYPH